MQLKALAVPVAVIVLAVGGVMYLSRPRTEQFGAADTGAVATVAINDIGTDLLGRTVAIEGTILRECPHSGCWAVIRDDTGQIRIDTNAGGFALPLHREGSRIRIVGVVQQTEGGDLEISAQSAQL